MASTEKKRKTKTKKTRASTSANPISPKAKPKRKSSTARSAFPTQEMSTQAMRKKMNEMEVTIKSLTRDNKVLARKIERMDMTSGKKTKKIDAEKDMRLNANKERYWLKQKLDRLQKAIEARLKLLGIDFSNINDLGEALEAAFAAIQKLAAELAKKEDELAAMQDKLDRAKKAQEDSAKEVDKLNRRVAKAKNANDDLKKQMADKDKRLDAMGKQKDSMSDKEKQKQNEMDKLRKELDALRKQKNKQFDNFVDKKAEMDKKLRDKDSECKELERELDDTKKKNEKLDAKNKKLEDELEKLRGLMDKQHEKLMAEKEKNKELKTEMDELRDELEDANKRNDKLKKANDALKEELDETKATLAEKEEMIKAQQKQIEENEARIQALEDDLKDRDAEIQRLKDENAALKDELAKLRALLEATQKELQDQKDKYAQLEKEKAEGEEEMQAMFSEQKEMNDMLKKKIANMTNKMKEQEQTIDDQDNQLSELKQALEDERRAKEAALATGNLNEQESADALSALTQEKAQLKKMCDDLKGKMNDRDDEIARLKKALADAKKALDDLVNRARDDKQTQTDLSGKWIDNARMQLANLDNVFRENDELRQLATKNDERLLELADENKVLLDEIDQLLKQQAQFRPDTSNHRGEVLAMCASPINYYAATSATDKSVRLWAIDPTAEKSREQVKPVYRAQMEGVALSLAYTRDGTYLVAGCAYKNGPEGLLIIWNMNKGDGEVEFLFRSRPSVRFGRAHCVRWSDDSRYIFSGDTTGSVWIWDAPNQILLAEVRAHKDVVHDIGVARSAMFSCGLDQTIAVFDMDRLTKKKKKRVKKDKIHVHKPTVFKAKQVNKNDKYPYWVVQPTEDASVLIAGARKMWSFKFTGFKDSDDAKKKDVSDADLDKGPRITDTDLEHVQSIQVRRGQVVISRRELTKVKIFSTSNGSETAKAKFKAPVKRVQFTFDNQNCVVCTQKQDGKKAKPPG
eukprot:147474_1